MSLDPRIILGGQAPQQQSPLEMLTTVAQLQGLREQTEARRLAAEEARQKAKDAAAVRQVFTDAKGDIEVALPTLRQIAPAAALEFEKAWHETTKEKYAAVTNQIQSRAEAVKWGAGIASRVVANPALAPAMREYLQTFSEQMGPLIPKTDDPAEWQQFSDQLLTSEQRFTQSREDLKLFGEGKQETALARSLSRATNAEDWDGAIKGFRGIGGPKIIADGFGTYSPENVKRAAAIATKPTTPRALQQKDVLLDGKPALVNFDPDTGQSFLGDQDVSARIRPAPPPPPQGPYMWAVAPGGEGQSLMTPAEIRAGGAQKAPEPATHQQSLASGFARRLEQSEPTFAGDVGTTIAGMSLPVFAVQTEGWFARPTFQSNEVQKYMQSARNFINAVLRRESGAVISPEEFANAKQQYLPIPGDTAEAAAQKKANRDLVFQSMREEAGSAYKAPAPNGTNTPGARPARPSGPNPFRK